MIWWRGVATVLIICFSIGRGRGSKDEVEEVDLRSEMIWSSGEGSNCSREKGKVLGVVGMIWVGRVVESLLLKYLSNRSGSSSGVTVGRGALSERPSSWAENIYIYIYIYIYGMHHSYM